MVEDKLKIIKKPVIAITMGDAAGIGPEIILKSLERESIYNICKPLILGDIRIMERIRDICERKSRISAVKDINNLKSKYGTIEVLNYDDVSPEDFCAAVKKGAFDVLGLSALLTTTMASIDLTVAAIEEAGFRENIKIIIGGAPVTQGYADKIGVDAFGRDAWDAVNKAEKLLSL